MQDAFSLLSPGQALGIPQRVSLLWRSPSPEEKADSGNTASGFDFSSKEGFPTRAELWVPLPRFASSWSGRKQRQRPAKAGREEANALVSHCCWFTSLELSLEGSGQDTSWPAPHGPWAETTALRSTRPLLELEGIPREEEGGDRVLCDLSLTLKAVRLIFPSFGSPLTRSSLHSRGNYSGTCRSFVSFPCACRALSL